MRFPVKVMFLLVPLTIGGTLSAQDTTATADRVIDPGKAFLAALIPGGGQIYNKTWFRAGLVISGEIFYAIQFQISRAQYNNYDHYTPSLPLPKGRYLEKRNKYAWWIAFVYIMGMMDAYVEAHLSSFPTESIDRGEETTVNEPKENQ